MARRKKGRDISGWVIVDKPSGMSSTSVVGKVRWAFDANKAGHAGTLDPEATGLLAIALGEATKTVPFVTDANKAYRFTVTLGAATNTDDSEGEVIKTSDKRPSDDDIRAALPVFTGDIQQVPPQFSAVKIDGQRAYALARGGEDIDLAPRPLRVERLELIERVDADTVILEMECGKGGYVRSIARDLGEYLGCFGHVLSLRRIWSGPFTADEAVSLETLTDLARTPDIEDLLLPLETGLQDLPHCILSAEGAVRISNGNPGAVVSSEAAFGEVAWGSHRGVPVAVGIYQAGELRPTRVFRL